MPIIIMARALTVREVMREKTLKLCNEGRMARPRFGRKQGVAITKMTPEKIKKADEILAEISRFFT